MIRVEAGLTVVRFCELAGVPQSTWYRRRARSLMGDRPAKGPWPAPKRRELEAVEHFLALRYPGVGHRKIGALTVARGDEVSLSIVYRIMFERGLVHPARYEGEGWELANVRRAVFGNRRAGATRVWQTAFPSLRPAPAGWGRWAAWLTT
jgi:hypothetical protein